MHINKAPHYRDQLAIISDFPCAHHLCVTPSTGDMTLPLVGDTSSPSKGRKVMVLSPGEDEGMFVSPLDTYRTITPATPQVIEYVMQWGGQGGGGRGGGRCPPNLIIGGGGGIVPPPPPPTLGYNTQGCLRVHYCLYSVTVCTGESYIIMSILDPPT